MKKVKMAISGIGGYGDYCLGLMERFVDPESCELVAAIDRFTKKHRAQKSCAKRAYRCFAIWEEFYAENSCELLLIASPIHLHKQQCLTAFAHGSNVLCEKPLAPILQDAHEIDEAARKAGVKLGVGFQMSFCRPIQELKRDILSGLLGKPLMLKSYVSWQRYDSYYNSPWKAACATGTATSFWTPSSPTPPHTICTTPASFWARI